MKKKLGMLLLVPAVTLSLAACGNDDGRYHQSIQQGQIYIAMNQHKKIY